MKEKILFNGNRSYLMKLIMIIIDSIIVIRFSKRSLIIFISMSQQPRPASPARPHPREIRAPGTSTRAGSGNLSWFRGPGAGRSPRPSCGATPRRRPWGTGRAFPRKRRHPPGPPGKPVHVATESQTLYTVQTP